MSLVHFSHELTVIIAKGLSGWMPGQTYICDVVDVVMDLSVLQLFIEVMRQGSFAAVARDRQIAPSSVSRTIAGLEAELGIRLFQRTTR